MVDIQQQLSTRRRLLSTGITGITLAISGCSQFYNQEDTSQPRSPPVLCGCQLVNSHDETHTIYVLIERGDDIVHWSKAELKPNTTKSVELGDWHEKPGDYTVSGSFDDLDSWSRENLSDINDEDCVLPSVEVLEDGQLRVVALL